MTNKLVACTQVHSAAVTALPSLDWRKKRDFPPTHVSIIARLSDADPDARRAAGDLVARAYWGPVAAALRYRWNLDLADAEDLAQEFFADALSKDWLAKYDPARARFRTFLRLCVDRFAANALDAKRTLKRGGNVTMVSIDDPVTLPPADDDVDAHFRDEWVRSVFTLALERLRAEGEAAGKTVHVSIFEAYDVADDEARPSYKALAERFGIAEMAVTNHLAWARRAFRRAVLDVLRALAGSDAEFREDAQDLLGVRPS